eukprot:531250-Pleurochrysis_carterae.AAC.3
MPSEQGSSDVKELAPHDGSQYLFTTYTLYLLLPAATARDKGEVCSQAQRSKSGASSCITGCHSIWCKI